MSSTVAKVESACCGISRSLPIAMGSRTEKWGFQFAAL
jgi:hypothetical protein